jgi:copper homeostasis protein
MARSHVARGTPHQARSTQHAARSNVSLLLEVIVQSLADAEEAEAGGADRLEVVREIERDGLTPPLELVRSLLSATSLPLRVMVRESDGFSVTSPRELVALQRAFADLADLGVHGAVVGFARGGRLDLDLMASVLAVAPGLPVTLHRAFDAVDDPEAAIDAALAFPQIDRILTSGGSGDWATRCQRLTAWSRRAGPRITMLPGGGVDEPAIAVLTRCPSVAEVHVGKAARGPQASTAPVSAARVRHLKSLTR